MTYYHSYMQQRESECRVMSQNDQKVRISNNFYSVCPTVESTQYQTYEPAGSQARNNDRRRSLTDLTKSDSLLIT
jgi:hypothetical protein